MFFSLFLFKFIYIFVFEYLRIHLTQPSSTRAQLYSSSFRTSPLSGATSRPVVHPKQRIPCAQTKTPQCTSTRLALKTNSPKGERTVDTLSPNEMPVLEAKDGAGVPQHLREEFIMGAIVKL